jgi:TolB protein
MRSGLVAAVLLLPRLAMAQDSTTGVRVGITYTPGTRPAVTIIASGAGAVDTVRAVLQADLDQSDRFDVAARPAAAELPDARMVSALGVDYAVIVAPGSGGAALVRLVDVRSGAERFRRMVPAGRRLLVHAAADGIVQAVFGQPGIAATSLLFVRSGRIWRIDADGQNAAVLRTAGFPSLSPAWSPDGRRFAYTAFVRSGQPIVVQDLASRDRVAVPGTEYGLNITPAFSPDGRRLAYAHGTEAGMDIYLAEGGGGRWEEGGPLTAGRFADNLSPAWSPDGSRVAFISNRARSPQLYVMNADGTGQELLARFDFGATGQTSAPAWSPDGALIAFHREVGGTPQVFVLDVAAGALRQITGSGRNEDPTWAPDSRHLAFVSSRVNGREVWVVDLETGRLRQVTTLGGARLPAWSPRLTPNGGSE